MEQITLWKDPDARWESGTEFDDHPCGEIQLDPVAERDAVPLLEIAGNTFSYTISLTVICRLLPE